VSGAEVDLFFVFFLSGQTTVDKLEWKRWEEDIKNVREAKGILTLDVNTEYDEQLPTAALQTVLVDGIAGALPVHSGIPKTPHTHTPHTTHTQS
jgi:hypothetical protein